MTKTDTEIQQRASLPREILLLNSTPSCTNTFSWQLRYLPDQKGMRTKDFSWSQVMFSVNTQLSPPQDRFNLQPLKIALSVNVPE
jgi:hypothetical protein